uniref:NmrA-like domain-containing protein n=1 Tax=Picea sitchensis TaxID=3332 RepID=A9NLB0_PICSI|nr:unknown [Picea sitchensis]
MASSRILIIGGTGSIGRYVAKASIANGHPTFVLVRDSTASNPEKAQLLESFKASGITLLHGSLDNYASLLEAIKLVDVVICTVGAAQIADQFNIISTIKEVGSIKRFLPSEFGNVVEKEIGLDPVKSMYQLKAKVRRTIEAEGIPHTYISSNYFAGHFIPSLGQSGLTAPPRDKVVILGDGNAKAVFVVEEDVATYTIKAVNDPRTLNKILYMRLPANTLSVNELVGLWENKIGKTLDKLYVPEEQVIKSIQDTQDFLLSLYHSTFVQGNQTNFEIGANGVEATQLYPEVKYTTVDEYLNQFV